MLAGGPGRPQVTATTSGGRQGRWKTRTKISVALALTVAAGTAAGALVIHGGADGGAPVADKPESTVPVTKTDLVETQQVDGTLGYAGSVSVTASTSDMVTWLPQPGRRRPRRRG